MSAVQSVYARDGEIYIPSALHALKGLVPFHDLRYQRPLSHPIIDQSYFFVKYLDRRIYT